MYGVFGPPTVYFVDREGNLIGRLVGARNWASPAARKFIEQLLVTKSTRSDGGRSRRGRRWTGRARRLRVRNGVIGDLSDDRADLLHDAMSLSGRIDGVKWVRIDEAAAGRRDLRQCC